MIFLVYGHNKVLMSYEMDSGKVQFIHDLGHGTDEPYIPYVPLYSESFANGYWSIDNLARVSQFYLCWPFR
jgi:hypothetical protein